jgi:hypothetical protein
MNMVDERRRGPGSMSGDELAAFLTTQPSGAICVTDDAGRLLPVPARVLDAHGGVLRVALPGTHSATFGDEQHACVVADTFESYDAIRGFIARGPAHADDSATRPIAALTMVRVATFSFAGASDESNAQSPTD